MKRICLHFLERFEYPDLENASSIKVNIFHWPLIVASEALTEIRDSLQIRDCLCVVL